MISWLWLGDTSRDGIRWLGDLLVISGMSIQMTSLTIRVYGERRRIGIGIMGNVRDS